MKNAQIIVAFLLLLGLSSYAQEEIPERKLKNSVRAPGNIKIDGKLTEWDNKLKAYSNHTQFYYAVSNDDNNLYLTVQARYREIIDRILFGGITLTINKSATKTDPNSISITYPVTKMVIANLRAAPKVKNGDSEALEKLESFVNEANGRLASRGKFIKVTGIKGVDSTISIYNLDRVKAAALLDKQLYLNYEIAVSLADIGLDNKKPQKFVYRVMINETLPPERKPGEIYISGNPFFDGQPATDFWGEYTLAK